MTKKRPRREDLDPEGDAEVEAFLTMLEKMQKSGRLGAILSRMGFVRGQGVSSGHSARPDAASVRQHGGVSGRGSGEPPLVGPVAADSGSPAAAQPLPGWKEIVSKPKKKTGPPQAAPALDPKGWSVPVLETTIGLTISDRGVICVQPDQCRQMIGDVRFASSIALLCSVRCSSDAVEVMPTFRASGKVFSSRRYLHQIGDEEDPVRFEPVVEHVTFPTDTQKVVLTSVNCNGEKAAFDAAVVNTKEAARRWLKARCFTGCSTSVVSRHAKRSAKR